MGGPYFRLYKVDRYALARIIPPATKARVHAGAERIPCHCTAMYCFLRGLQWRISKKILGEGDGGTTAWRGPCCGTVLPYPIDVVMSCCLGIQWIAQSIRQLQEEYCRLTEQPSPEAAALYWCMYNKTMIVCVRERM